MLGSDQFDICGRFALWNEPSREPVPFTFGRNSIRASSRAIDLVHASHDGPVVASVAAGTLQIFLGLDGAYFGARLGDDRLAVTALRDIAAARIDGASALISYDRSTDLISASGGEKVIRCDLRHIAIVNAPKSPGTAVWLAAAHRDEVPRSMWGALDGWKIARLRHEREARRARTESARLAASSASIPSTPSRHDPTRAGVGAAMRGRADAIPRPHALVHSGFRR